MLKNGTLYTDIVSSVDSFSILKGAPVFPAVLVYLSRMALKHCTPDKGGVRRPLTASEAAEFLRFGCYAARTRRACGNFEVLTDEGL